MTDPRGRLPWLVAAVVLAATLGSPLASGDPAADPLAEIADLAAEARRADPGSDDRARSLARLERLAGGPLSDSGTRAASFALAQVLLESATDADRRKTIAALSAATALYQNDPRTPSLLAALARLQLANHDPFGAHLSFDQLFRLETERADPGLRVIAAANAAAVGDAPKAYAWTLDVDPEQLDESLRIEFHLARLKAGHTLGRYDEALESSEALSAGDDRRFRLDGRALLAAARTMNAAGRLELAADLYARYINIHSGSDERAAALLELGRLYIAAGKLDRAGRHLRWLVELHPDRPESTIARLELLELNGRPAGPEQVDAYLAVIRDAATLAGGRAACKRFADRFLGGGYPLELLAGLVALARAPSDGEPGLTPLAARDAIENEAEPILALLAERDDLLGLAAASLELESVEVELPRSQREAIEAARRATGLGPYPIDPARRALVEARALAEAGERETAVQRLQLVLTSARGPSSTTELEATLLLAELLWRLERIEEARASLRPLLDDSAIPAELLRAARLLDADLLYGEGRREDSCASYRRAASLGDSPWLTRQLEGCPSDGESS